MLLLHLGIPPSGHGYAPPIAVAVITVLAKKGCTVLKCICAFITPLPLLCQKNFPSMAKKPYWLLNRPRENTTPLRRIQTSPGTARPHSHRRNRAANMAQHVFLFLLYESRIPFPETGYGKPCHRTRAFFAPPGSGVFLHKRKGRKSVLNIRGWIPSLLFLVELVMFLTMFPFIKEIRLFVPAHGAVNQTGNVFF